MTLTHYVLYNWIAGEIFTAMITSEENYGEVTIKWKNAEIYIYADTDHVRIDVYAPFIGHIPIDKEVYNDVLDMIEIILYESIVLGEYTQ